MKKMFNAKPTINNVQEIALAYSRSNAYHKFAGFHIFSCGFDTF